MNDEHVRIIKTMFSSYLSLEHLTSSSFHNFGIRH